ncbi:initiation factor 2 [Auriscalpium vulgare]|uniref:Initiation factor 2 n=1 Tax=Auriscalpium vulgare TaxID=40419 RepID=A0ACB8S3L7_9AGAM|nr:initiation factor 2 [Auriscalpium vulgare]
MTRERYADDKDPAPHLAVPGSSSRAAPATRGSHADTDDKRINKRTPTVPLDPLLHGPQAETLEHERPEHVHRRAKLAFKQRGSLAHDHSSNPAIRSQHRPQSSRPTAVSPIKVRKPSKKEFKRPKIDVFIPSVVSVGNLARLLKVSLERLQRKMREAGMGEDASYDHVLTSDYAALLADEFHRNPIINDEAAFDIYASPPPADKSGLPPRPPIVTIMGHVDHGKTTLLDTLRSSSVAQGEAGGITQHIGAFSVPVASSAGGDGKRSITFLDTPGHAAFSAMRARGADVTDIVVLVVAADDGVKPQTKEVIELVQKDPTVQLVVAINKVDKPGVDVEKVQLELMTEGIQLESMGGDIPSVEVSGLTGLGLDQLVENISLVAEMQDLRAEHDGRVHGQVLESKMQKGLGPVATVLLLRGCLTPGSHIICGTTQAKVRVMTDSAGKTVKAAYPGMAVTVSGWKELPSAGDEVLQGTEQEIKKAVANRLRKAELDSMLVDIEAINSQRRTERERKELEAEAEAAGTEYVKSVPEHEGPKELRLVIKGDVSGSVEALEGALQSIGNEEARVKIVSTAVGEVTEADILRAKAANGIIIAFSVPVPKAATVSAGMNNVPIYSSTIIYRVMEEVTKRVTDLLPSKFEKRVTGEAKVLQVFDIQLSGKRTKSVAGCRVVNGTLHRNKTVQVVRDGQVLHEGRLDTFRHLKDDIAEASKGMECGLSLDMFSDLKKDDSIQVYQEVELPKNL